MYLCLERRSRQLLWYYTPQTNARASVECLVSLTKAHATKKYLVVVWDNASWHKAHAVAHWLQEHNATARARGRPRLFVFFLPTYSPWLNPVEAIFNQTKRRVLFGRNLGNCTERRRALDSHFTQRNTHTGTTHKVP